MKSLTLACYIALTRIPGVLPERPHIHKRLGEGHHTAVLQYLQMDVDDEVRL